ncbi:hypothetical protein ACIQUQ_03930 [Streptomyces sp. NPDC101118]|uniref:hypothetical protein n=1 Tax=Streptomyces sp. NPDC101118 TaxID=3366109 RepID=UPI00380EEE11
MRKNAVPVTAAALLVAGLLGGCTTQAVPDRPVRQGADGPGGGAEPCPGLAETGSGPAAVPTAIGGTPANTPEAQRLGQAIGDQGYGAFADVYAGHITDQPAGRVALCVTDLERGRQLLAAARQADPAVDPHRADLYLARYTARALAAAVEKVMRGSEGLGHPVHDGSASSDASAIVIGTTAEGAASARFKERLERLAAPVPVEVRKGDPVNELTEGQG